MPRLSHAPKRLASSARRIAPPAKTALPFYQSAEWRTLRATRMRDPDYRDAKQRANGGRVILDHIIEIRDGGAPLDPKNTQWLTFAEHQVKTEAAKRARVGGLRQGG